MQATITTVPMIEPTLWALATILLALYGTALALSMIKEEAINKSMERSYED